MGDFDDMLAADASAFDELGGESITYTPPGGTARSIIALIDRNDPNPVEGMNNVRRPGVVVNVKNSATTGVSSAEAIRQGKFTIPIRRGHATTMNLVIEDERKNLTAQDAGRLTFTF